MQVAEQREHDRDRDQVALVELELHAVGSSALKLFTVNTRKFHLSSTRLALAGALPVMLPLTAAHRHSRQMVFFYLKETTK